VARNFRPVKLATRSCNNIETKNVLAQEILNSQKRLGHDYVEASILQQDVAEDLMYHDGE
jgi:hypothetical protein